MTGELNEAQRRDDLSRATQDTADILVIGGGVVGAGIALDAASRGLSVTLIEAHDWAWGTSSRSSKLIHGGLRYLQSREIHLVSEALSERGRLASTIAPHLVSDVPFVYPLTKGRWERPYAGAGLTLYDALGRLKGRTTHNLPTHSHLTARTLRENSPSLRADAHHGGLLYHDASVDDARLVLALVRTAAEHGARVINRLRATSLTVDTTSGTANGVVAVEHDGTAHTLHARRVIIAAGPGTNSLKDTLGEQVDLSVTASKGVHIVVSRDRITSRTGIIAQTATSIILAIPWHAHWLIGTTDTPWNLADGVDPAATAEDVTYLLDTVNTLLESPLEPRDIIGVQAGLRPLVSDSSSGATSKLSREHTIATSARGVTWIAGGKYTTYRIMAKDAVDTSLGEHAGDYLSRTADLPLLGARNLEATRRAAGQLARTYGLTETTATRLIDRYGDQAPVVMQLGDSEPSQLMALPGAGDHLVCEVTYAIRSEGATTLEDVLSRRLRTTLEGPDQGLLAAGAVGRIMRRELGWTAQHEASQVDAYQESMRAQTRALRELTHTHDTLIARKSEPEHETDL